MAHVFALLLVLIASLILAIAIGGVVGFVIWLLLVVAFFVVAANSK